MTAVRKMITSMEPVSPSARMMAAGSSTVAITRRKDRGVFMGWLERDSCRARIRMMDSFANSEG